MQSIAIVVSGLEKPAGGRRSATLRLMTRGLVDGMEAIRVCNAARGPEAQVAHVHDKDWRLFGLAAHVLSSENALEVVDVREVPL